MIEKLIFIALIFCGIVLLRVSEKKYLKKSIWNDNRLLIRGFLGLPVLTSPKSFLIKNTFWKGYISFLLVFAIIILSLYLLINSLT